MPMHFGNQFPATLADMQDAYGLVGNTSTPAPSSRTSSSAPRSASSASTSSTSFSFSRMLRKKERASNSNSSSSPSAPTPSPTSSRRSSIDSQITLATPTTVSGSKPMSAPPRDYEAVFGALSSTYGFGGTVPMPNPTPSTPSTTSRKSTSRKSDRSCSNTPYDVDEQTANLGELMSKYGVSSGPSAGGYRR